ncbi:hypothetical protein LPJ56_000721 [Coemansia sp. RSA 2599]|nr:hypothetical protein LPJ75_000302 [Coemansia sp. RSA 2598]KAJ1828992.1 hypothetical protein LPJ56_000721 [Coemansia sp. RSA 2599]
MAFKNTAIVALAALAAIGSVSALPQNFGGDDLNAGVHLALASILGDTAVAGAPVASSAPNFDDLFDTNNNVGVNQGGSNNNLFPSITVPDFNNLFDTNNNVGSNNDLFPSISMPDFNNLFDGAHEALASILGDPDVMKSASQAMNSINKFISDNPGFLSSVKDNLVLPTGTAGNDNSKDNDSEKDKDPSLSSGASGIKPFTGVVAAAGLAAAAAAALF